MKSFMGLFLFLFTLNAYPSDSMVIFQHPEETIILVNETSSQEKLDILMDSLGFESEMSLVSKNEDISLRCGRGAGAKSCTFSFKVSSEVKIDGQNTYVYSDSSNSEKFRSNSSISLEFKNEKGDVFVYKSDHLYIAAEVLKQ